MVLVVVLSVITQASSLWRTSTGKIAAFQSARAGFDLLTRSLSQATLNTYLDYDNPMNPSTYLRKSELAFVSGPASAAGFPGTLGCGQAVFFQAPLGYATNTTSYGKLESLMNTCGYYVAFTTNNAIPPHVAVSSNPLRYRLMQLLVPTENNTIYTASSSAWFTGYTVQARPLADNIIALIVRPQDPGSVSPSTPDLTTNYAYDSTKSAASLPQPPTANQMPPVVQVTLVAIDEASAKRLEESNPGAIASALSGKFQITTNYATDLSQLEDALSAQHIQYRIFSTAVPIRESKWTK